MPNYKINVVGGSSAIKLREEYKTALQHAYETLKVQKTEDELDNEVDAYIKRLYAIRNKNSW